MNGSEMLRVEIGQSDRDEDARATTFTMTSTAFRLALSP
jgi:hypothetical protein